MNHTRPLGLRLANRLAGLPPLSGRLGLDADELIQSATTATGESDFGDDAWREGFHVLTRALQTEARLTPAGRFFARGQLLSALCNRLRIEAYLAANPAALDSDIDAPIVVLGLPRTGSTLLQNLLSLDPDNRSLWHWEAAAPAPPPRTDLDADDARVSGARRAVKLLDYLAPDARRLHPVDADDPTECVTLFTNSFASLELTVINWVPSYLQWCLETDMTAHYDYYLRQLKLLQTHNRRPRWVLKSPAHLFWVDQVVRTFPDVRLVQIHRDPVDVLASYFDLVAALTGIGSSALDPRAVGPIWTRTWADGLTRADAVRRTSNVPVADVHYKDLVREPVETVRRLYEAFGLDVGTVFENRLRNYVARDRYTSGRRAGSTLESYGVERSEVRAAFDDYCTRHGVGEAVAP